METSDLVDFFISLIDQYRILPEDLSIIDIKSHNGSITYDQKSYLRSYYITTESWILYAEGMKFLRQVLSGINNIFTNLPYSSLLLFALSTDPKKYIKFKEDYKEIKRIRETPLTKIIQVNSTNKKFMYYPFKDEVKINEGFDLEPELRNLQLGFNPVTTKLVIYILDKESFWSTGSKVICDSALLHHFDKPYLPLIFDALLHTDTEKKWFKLGLTKESRDVTYFDSLIKKIDYAKKRSFPSVPKAISTLTSPKEYLSSYTDSELLYFYQPFFLIERPSFIETDFNMIDVVINNTSYWTSYWAFLSHHPDTEEIIFANLIEASTEDYKTYSLRSIVDYYKKMSNFSKEQFIIFLESVIDNSNTIDFTFDINKIKNLKTQLLK
jgi:hypothetical protein